MKFLQNLFLAIVSIILLNQTVNAQIILTRLGYHPFHQPPLTSSTDLINMIQENESDIKIGFELAGIQNLFNDFIMQLPNTKISKVKLHDGTHFEWMLGRKNGIGPVVIAKEIIWINKTPISAFKFHIDKNGKRYTFAVPLICSNIALRGITLIPLAIAPPAKEIVNKTSETEEVAVLPTLYTTEKPTENKDIIKTKRDISPIDTVMPMASAVPLKFLADLGYLHQFDPGHYLFGRVGAEYNFTDKFSLLGLVGVAPHISGTDGKTAFVFDLFGEIVFSRSFIDLGLGGWFTKGDKNIKSENSQFDIITVIGTMIIGEKDDFNVSLFFEARHGLNELDDMHTIRSFGRYGGGLRFRF